MGWREEWNGPKVAFGRFGAGDSVEIWGFSHYGGVRARKKFQVGDGWVRLGSVFFGHVKTQLDPGVMELWDRAVAEATALGQALNPVHALVSLLETRPNSRAAKVLAESGLTAKSARDLLRQTPLEPAPATVHSALQGLDIEALAKVGIDFDRVRAALEREFGKAPLDVADKFSNGASDPAAVPIGVKKTVHWLAGSAAIRLGESKVTWDHALLGILNAGTVENLVLKPLDIDPAEVSRRIEAVLQEAR